MLMYSPTKNSPKRIPEYSVWKPATSSPSASGRSNGILLHSASMLTRKIRKAIGWYTMNGTAAWAFTISARLNDLASITTGTRDSPMESS